MEVILFFTLISLWIWSAWLFRLWMKEVDPLGMSFLLGLIYSPLIWIVVGIYLLFSD